MINYDKCLILSIEVPWQMICQKHKINWARGIECGLGQGYTGEAEFERESTEEIYVEI